MIMFRIKLAWFSVPSRTGGKFQAFAVDQLALRSPLGTKVSCWFPKLIYLQDPVGISILKPQL